MDLLKDIHDEEILKQLDLSRIAEQIESDSEWRLIKILAEKAVELAVREFAFNVKVTKDMDVEAFKYKIIELQQTIRTYRYELFDEIKQLQRNGKIAFGEAQDRELID